MSSDQQVREQLHHAVSARAGACDGAITPDDLGFNKADTYHGRVLAMISPQDWDPKMDRAVWEVLRKYAGQLEREHGIDFDAIPEPPRNGRDRIRTNKRLIWALQGCWLIEFPYEDVRLYVPIMKENGGTFNGSTDPKRWELQDSQDTRDLIDELHYMGFQLATSAQDLLSSPVRTAPPTDPVTGTPSQGDLDYDAGTFLITFDKYKKKLREAIKEIPGRKFSWDDLRWEVPVRQHTAVVELLKEYPLTLTPAAQEVIDTPPDFKPGNRIELDGDLIRVYFDYHPEIHARVKNVPGRQYLDDLKATKATGSPEKHWTIPINQAQHALDLCREFPIFGCPGDVMELATRQGEQKANNLQSSRATVDDLQIDGLRGTMFPFQSAGARYCMSNKRVLLADEQGLGKTIQALATVQGLGSFPTVVVCPSTLKINWKKEATKWLPQGTIIQILNGRKSIPLGGSKVYIINYDVLPNWLDKLISVNPKAVIFDESHYIKNHKAKRSQAAVTLAKVADVRLCLTGTPIINRPQELINQLQALGRLDDLGGFWHVARRYCGYNRGYGFGDPRNLEELNQKLRENCFIRRVKKEVLTELPPKTYSTVPVQIDNRRDYDRAEQDVVEYLRETKGAGASAAAMAAEAIVQLNTLRGLTGNGKINAAIKWIETFLESGEKLIVFAHHVAVTQAIAKHFDAPMVVGGVSAKKKNQAVERFQEDPDTKVIVGNLQSMGTGLTLTAASHVLIVEYAWTPAELAQAEDRAHRIGQDDNVTCYYLSGEGTIDLYFEVLLSKKRAIVDAATEGDPVQDQSLVSEMIDALIDPRGRHPEPGQYGA